jgi:hypothetical protein
MGITRDKPPCWNAGTPVEWDDSPNVNDVVDANDVNNANQAVDADGIIDGKRMKALTKNVSEDGESIPVLAAKKIGEDFTEYHPLIQFYNEVMARLVKDRMTRDLDNLRGPTSARRLWQYLERKYLNHAEDADASTEFADFLKKFHEGQDSDKLPQYQDGDTKLTYEKLEKLVL